MRERVRMTERQREEEEEEEEEEEHVLCCFYIRTLKQSASVLHF